MWTQIVSMVALLIVEGSGITNIQTNNIYETISPGSGNDDAVDNVLKSLLIVQDGNTTDCPSTTNLQDFEKGRLAMKNKDSGQCLFMDITENLSNAVEMTNDKERSRSTYLMKDSIIIKVFPVTSDTILEVAGKDILDFCHGYDLLYGQHIEQSVHPPCIISDWAAWSSPDSNGISFRTRYLIRPAPNNECGHLHVVEFRNG
ncbi:unnamed protein product [Mytilus edulis]|uniref:Uncharacterized protein n=1 Tax=Mytilus edulis TaxID=6550 RepID=A0A8S3T9W4_MYTED|nr:unnamed protein product [Mytilus edulis]